MEIMIIPIMSPTIFPSSEIQSILSIPLRSEIKPLFRVLKIND